MSWADLAAAEGGGQAAVGEPLHRAHAARAGVGLQQAAVLGGNSHLRALFQHKIVIKSKQRKFYLF